MKNYVLTITLILTIVFGIKAQKLSKMAPQVVIVNIGAKNPTFNEKQYPNLKFYYAPNLKPENKGGETTQAAVGMLDGAKFIYEGEPKFLKEIWNNNLDPNAFMLFDKNNYCYAQGEVISDRSIAASICTSKKPLSDPIKACVKKGKTIKPSKKELSIVKKKLGITTRPKDFLVGFQMPELKLSNAAGEEKSFNDIINNKPTLVVFINIPVGIDIEKAYTEKVATGKAMFSAASVAKQAQVLVDLEGEIFEYDARRK